MSSTADRARRVTVLNERKARAARRLKAAQEAHRDAVARLDATERELAYAEREHDRAVEALRAPRR